MVQRFRFKNVKLTFYLSDSFSSIEKNIVLNKLFFCFRNNGTRSLAKFMAYKDGLVNKMFIKYTEKN